ncbi:uncharacterized protein [Euphorbia lathyris]|uniref:uncharacterized protein isoform X4 n=1 Tax=Euphorbia lathyris TaxID=212925 RepID=UPI003313732A
MTRMRWKIVVISVASLKCARKQTSLGGESAQAAAKAEKWLPPIPGGYLEPEGVERTWRIQQESIAPEVDILSSKNQHDVILPGCLLSY